MSLSGEINMARDFNVVHICEFGKFDMRTLLLNHKEVVEEFWKYFEQWIRRMEKDSSSNEDKGIVLIIDFDEYALKHGASPEGEYFFG